jgi:hypothetical protein
MLALYFSIVRGVLEYGCQVWSPFYSVHCEKIESIQKRLLRILCFRNHYGRSVSGYDQRLAKFGLVSLQLRRKHFDLMYLYKIIHSYVDSPYLLSLININIRYRIRAPNTFSLPVYKNNTSYYNPIVRMCREYNDLVAVNRDLDVFGSKMNYYKRSVGTSLKSKN